MTDPDMSSVWRFVAETNLDEIFSGTVTSDSATGGANETSVAIKTELTAVSINSDTSSEASYDDKTSVASFNSDEISEGGDSDEDAKRVINAPTKAEIKRLKQQAYDKRYREKMKVKLLLYFFRAKTLKVNANALQVKKISLVRDFVAALKLLNLLLEDRVQRTRMVITTMRLVYLEEDTQPIAADRETIHKEVKNQLSLNQKATRYVESWTTTWTRVQVEKGKYFLKDKADDINLQIRGLTTLREQQTEATTELEWCTQQKRGFNYSTEL
ncbi:hypothetical protein PF005_g17968 [Phytophthora fragariae]|uniref:Uncharacterized protein n=1 Tax=Phytophthora fragariae TaxID=53985 RepID=A0A6A3RHW5_9STRA|nr:hypothetical protein PF009_g19052 [Phytophthora fragariae]KAE9093798.1 hypothetical protein PF007_g17999 [Phytophthora fragariae]KAE9193731.1 hypothetical protein PF005_g17968 [Phytophthora fragariae]KAE9208053.1 hypothetical protein PF004_g16870 [Phytophthora fragariae]